jgi:hypothetical protein
MSPIERYGKDLNQNPYGQPFDRTRLASDEKADCAGSCCTVTVRDAAKLSTVRRCTPMRFGRQNDTHQ